MNKFKQLLISLLLATTIIGCDIVEEPVVYRFCDDSGIDPSLNEIHKSSNPSNLRKILLEDYTGHTCGNCPEAGIKMKEMVTKYGPQIVPMAVHAGFFATPEDSYPTDFRTESGETYATEFNVVSNPNGMVNRSAYNGKTVIGIDQWDQAIAFLKDSASEVSLDVETVYNTDRRIVYINTDITILKASLKRYKIVAHLLEDHIIADQKDYAKADEHVKDYDHRHVLRTTAEGKIWGKEINNSDVVVNDNYKIEFDKLCVDQGWNDENCIVVVYIYDEATKEVVQAEEVHIRS